MAHSLTKALSLPNSASPQQPFPPGDSRVRPTPLHAVVSHDLGVMAPNDNLGEEEILERSTVAALKTSKESKA